jgi:hypothetical protein
MGRRLEPLALTGRRALNRIRRTVEIERTETEHAMETIELGKWVDDFVAKSATPVPLRLLVQQAHFELDLSLTEARDQLRDVLVDHPEVEAVGVERYASLRRVLEGATIRVRLEPVGLAFGFLRLTEAEHFLLAYDAFHDAAAADRAVRLEGAGGAALAASLHHVGGGQWQLRGLGRWLSAAGARPRDSVVLTVVDAKDRRFALRVEHARPADASAIASRNRSVAEHAADVLRALGPGRHLLFFVMRKLAARRALHHPIPPEPMAEIFASDSRFEVDATAVALRATAVPAAEPTSTIASDDPVGARLREAMPGRGYSDVQLANALRLWEAASIAMQPRVSNPAVWAAAVELSILRLDAPDKARAGEVAGAYGTGAAAASRRSGDILRALCVTTDDPRFSESGQKLRLAPDPFAAVEERYAERDLDLDAERSIGVVRLYCPRCRKDQAIPEPYRFVRGGRRGVAGRCPSCSRPLVSTIDDERPTRDAEGSP